MWGGIQWAGAPWAGIPQFAEVVYGAVSCAIVAITGVVDNADSAAVIGTAVALTALVEAGESSPVVSSTDAGASVCGTDELRQGI